MNVYRIRLKGTDLFWKPVAHGYSYTKTNLGLTGKSKSQLSKRKELHAVKDTYGRQLLLVGGEFEVVTYKLEEIEDDN